MQNFSIGRSSFILGIVLFTAMAASWPTAVDAENAPAEWAAHVGDTDRQGVQVRSGPGTEYAASFALPDGSDVRVFGEPVTDAEGQSWCAVALGGPGTAGGWVARAYLVPVLPSALGEVPLLSASVPAAEQPVRRLQATVTAYTYQTPGHGAHGSITRSGTVVHWGTVAVDPAVIPLGSVLSIEGYGDVFTAEDTGGAIHGSRIEIFFPDEEAALEFGVQRREVTIVGSASAASR